MTCMIPRVEYKGVEKLDFLCTSALDLLFLQQSFLVVSREALQNDYDQVSRIISFSFFVVL